MNKDYLPPQSNEAENGILCSLITLPELIPGTLEKLEASIL
jgi:hypothetical protein